MKKNILVIVGLIILLFPNSSKAQMFVEYSLGYGTYNMSDLKNLLIQDNTIANLKTTDNFPGYLIHNIYVGYKKNKSSLGLILGYQNTGGQRALSDYSGEYKYNIRAKGIKTGVFGRQMFSKGKKINFGAEIATGIIFNNVKLKNTLYLSQAKVSQKEEMKLKSINLFVQPSLIISYDLTKNIVLQAHAGYEWSPLKSKLKYENKRSIVNSDWNGFRICLNFIVSLNNIIKNDKSN